MPTVPTIKDVFEPIFAEEYPPSYGIVMLDGEPKSFSRKEIDLLDMRYYYVGNNYGTPVIARKTNV